MCSHWLLIFLRTPRCSARTVARCSTRSPHLLSAAAASSRAVSFTIQKLIPPVHILFFPFPPHVNCPSRRPPSENARGRGEAPTSTVPRRLHRRLPASRV